MGEGRSACNLGGLRPKVTSLKNRLSRGTKIVECAGHETTDGVINQFPVS